MRVRPVFFTCTVQQRNEVECGFLGAINVVMMPATTPSVSGLGHSVGGYPPSICHSSSTPISTPILPSNESTMSLLSLSTICELARAPQLQQARWCIAVVLPSNRSAALEVITLVRDAGTRRLLVHCTPPSHFTATPHGGASQVQPVLATPRVLSWIDGSVWTSPVFFSIVDVTRRHCHPRWQFFTLLLKVE